MNICSSILVSSKFRWLEVVGIFFWLGIFCSKNLNYLKKTIDGDNLKLKIVMEIVRTQISK